MERTIIKSSRAGSYLFVGFIVLFFHTVLAVPVLARDLVFDLGVLPGGTSSIAMDVSADGNVVVGKMTDASGHDHAFRWTQENNMVDLGTLPGGINTIANAVSANGSVVVGQAKFASGNSGHAFRWTQTTGMVALGALPGGNNSAAYGVSADGTVVVGVATVAIGTSSYNHAFRWTQAGGMQDLGTLGGSTSVANAVNTDGTVVVGQADLSSGSRSHAFRWTAAGMVDLIGTPCVGTLCGLTSSAYGVSTDGTMVVGMATDNIQLTPDYHAFSWTQATGLVDLGTLGGTDSIAYSVSDGNFVVGQSKPSSGGFEAMYWTQATGMQTINQWLAANAVDSSAFSFSDASAVSANGTAVVGQLTTSHAFLARTCYPLNPFYVTIGPTGGNIPICGLNASNNPGWISISGNGTGTVQFTVAANNSASVRIGTLTVDGQTFTVLQGTTSEQAKIGVFRSGAWYMDLPGTYTWVACGTDGCFSFGTSGDIPVMGDWDGTGIMRIGVFRNGVWYLDMNGNDAWDGSDVSIPFGAPGDIPVVGNWNGSVDGKTKIGIVRNGTWYLDYAGTYVTTRTWAGCGAPLDPTKAECIPFGVGSDVPVVGNWNGSADGQSKIGVFRNGTWYLDYAGTYATSGTWAGCGAPLDPTKAACIPFGIGSDVPVVGNWNGSANGQSKIGVFRNGMWYLDYAGIYATTGTWAGCGAPADQTKEVCKNWGLSSDIPVITK